MSKANPRVVRIGRDGAVTLSMPAMAGQYLLIEEEEGRVILKPFDLRWQEASASIARVGAEFHFVPSSDDRMLEA